MIWKNTHSLFTVLLALFISQNATAERIFGGYYTEERISSLRNNSLHYDWARELKEAAVEKAASWVSIPDDSLWTMVPGQDLPRCIDVTFDRLTSGPRSLGCLECGDEIKQFGNYPYNPDFQQMPWKLTCPSCQAVFPTNDFREFYLSALDERGLFNPAKGDRSLLYNKSHPDPNDPLHQYGVDDGFGYIDENGRGHRFIGYYSWKYWMYINNGLEALADAFLYTGEKRYAHKAAILLDRIADVYPDMDWKPYADLGWFHSDGGTHLGKIEGAIWETTVVQKFADSYDKIISGTEDTPELFAFLQRQSEKYQLPTPKGTRGHFLKNVDERILQTAFDAVLSRQIRGNQGMHQLTVAMCAIALNEEPRTTQWLDWIFEPDGGALPGLMISQLDRDGTSDEGAPSYSLMWGRLITQLASRLAEYPAYNSNSIFDDYPQFRASFLAAYRMAVLGKAIPNIGDSGAAGLVSNRLVDPELMVKGYFYTRDPELAVAAYRANGNSVEGLGRDIFSPAPEELGQEIKQIAEKAGPRPGGGYLMTGFGMALLESGAGDSGTALVSNYGRTIKHAHPDMLNFDLFAFGQWLTPDHGYPEFATRWPSRVEWTGSTISHNTVYVNRQPQKKIWGGKSRLFKQLKGFGVFELDGNDAYPDIDTYTRSMFLIDAAPASGGDGNAYVVDIFRVRGGYDHVYSFHGPPGTVTAPTLNLRAQRTGTYAGKAVPKGTWAEGFPIGYSHLYHVQWDSAPPPQFSLDWNADPGYRGLEADNVHLRLHALTQTDDLALADGDPPQNKPGNPESLKYALLHRSGENLNSTFVSLIEPYKSKPFIQSVQRLDDQQDKKVALKIDKTDGTIDYLLYNPALGEFKLPNGMVLEGEYGFVRIKNGQVSRGILINGKALRFQDFHLKSSGPLGGKILKMNKELTGGGWLVVDIDLPTDGSLNGQQIFISTGGERDASYTIEEVRHTEEGTRVYCGPISFISGYQGGETTVRNGGVANDYTEGFRYDFEEGAAFQIATHDEWNL